jgi:anti-sigma factor ChrR (cupin superfamily)
MLTCKDISTLSDEYLDGELPFKKKLSVKLHIAICKSCRRYLNYLQLTIHVVSQSESSSIDKSKIDEIMSKIELEVRNKP